MTDEDDEQGRRSTATRRREMEDDGGRVLVEEDEEMSTLIRFGMVRLIEDDVEGVFGRAWASPCPS